MRVTRRRAWRAGGIEGMCRQTRDVGGMAAGNVDGVRDVCSLVWRTALFDRRQAWWRARVLLGMAK